jgi:hypothetical protein
VAVRSRRSVAAVVAHAGQEGWSRALDPGFCRLLIDSHLPLVGSPLLPPEWSDARAAYWLYEAESPCVIAHDGGADPFFIYANKAAQACFEYDWGEITLLRSRLSAEAPAREERERLLAEVRRRGFVADYRGLRVAKSGRRFWIARATVWELIDERGHRHGQAAAFNKWRDA